MARRQPPKQSTLKAASPLTPSEATEKPLEEESATAPHSEPKSAPEGNPEAIEKPRKDGFYITPSDKRRAKRAQPFAKLDNDDLDSWTAYVNYAVMKLTKEIESQYNDSKPF